MPEEPYRIGKAIDDVQEHEDDEADAMGIVTVITVDELLLSAPDSFTKRVGLALCMCNGCDAMETLSAGFVLPQLQKEFSGVEYAAAAVFVGMLVGGALAGHFAKLIGARRFMVWMMRIEALAAVCGAMSRSSLTFSAWRLLGGLAIGAAVPSIFALAEELIFPVQRRRRWVNLIASTFIVGSLMVSVLALVMQGMMHLSWRAFYAATGVVPLCGAQLVLHWIPESPSFLLSHGRRAELRSELRKVGAFHGTCPQDPTFRLAANTSEIDQQSVESLAAPGLHPLLRMRWRGSLARLSLVCFAIAFAWYGLTTWLLLIFEHVGIRDAYFAGVLFALSGVPGVLMCMVLLSHVEPRKLLAFWIGCSSLSCVAISVMAPNDKSQRTKISPIAAAAAVCVFNSVSTAVFNVLTTVWMSPFPTELHLLAVSFLTVWMRVGSILAQFVDGALIRLHATGSMALVSAAVLLASAICCFGIKPLAIEKASSSAI